MSTLKPDLTRVWAATAPGANVVDPDVTTPGKVTAGWQAEVPPFEHFNFLQQWFTQGLAHANEQGIMVWDTDSTYPVDGLAKGSDGKVYKAVLEQSGNDPASDIGTNWIIYKEGVVSATEFGMINDDSTDNSAALLSLLQSGTTDIYLPKGTYAVDSVVDATLTDDLHFVGPGVIRWSGIATTGNMVKVECAGFDFSYLNIESKGNSLMCAGWLIENNSLTTTSVIKMVAGKFSGFRATLATLFNTNFFARGNIIAEIEGNVCDGPTRSDGLGTVATQSIVVQGIGTTLFPVSVKHFNNTYSGIDTDDTGAADNDTDYFFVNMPDPTNFPNGGDEVSYAQMVSESYGNTYLNPIGRCEKYQCVANSHDNVVIRNGDTGSRTIDGGSIDFNFQWGVGTCKNQSIWLRGSTTSPISTSYNPINYFQGTDYGEKRGSVTVDNIDIHNDIKDSLDNKVAVYVGLQLNATSSTKSFGQVSITNISMPNGNVDHAVILPYGTGGKGTVKLDNIMGNFNFNPIAIQDDCVDVTLNANNIENTSGSDVPLSNDVGGGSRGFNGVFSGGLGLTGITQKYEKGATTGQTPMLAGGALADGNKNSGGAVSVQSVFLADDATHVFDIRGFAKGNHMIMVNATFGTHTTQALLGCEGPSGNVISKNANTATNIDFSVAGSNPDTDGKLNLWVDATGAVNIKNRLGSSRAITIMYLG